MDVQRLFKLVRLLGIIIGLILSYFILKYGFMLLYPFGIAFIIAFVLNPFVSFIEVKWNVPRIIATIFVMLTVFLALIGSLFLLVVELIQGTIFLAEKVPKHFQAFMHIINHMLQEHFLPFYDKMTSFFNTLNPSQQNVISQNMTNILSQIGSSGAHFLQKVFLVIRKLLAFLPQSVMIMVFIVLATFLITKDLPHIRMWIRKKLPLTTRKSSINVFVQLRKLLFGYVKAQFFIILITACIVLVGLFIIQIDHALTIALFTALIDLLPFVGTGTVFIPWILYLFFTGNYSLTIQLTILYMVVIIVRQLIEPKILSDQLGVRPLITLIVMFVCYQIWGFIGIIFAPFLIVIYNAFYRAGIVRKIIQFVNG